MPPHEAAAYQGLWVIDSADGDNAILRGLPTEVPVTELLRLHEVESEDTIMPSAQATPPGTVPLSPMIMPLGQTPPSSLSVQSATPPMLPPFQTGAYTPPGTPPVPTGAYTPPGMPPATAHGICITAVYSGNHSRLRLSTLRSGHYSRLRLSTLHSGRHSRLRLSTLRSGTHFA